jgi:hypothetical protein
MAIEVEYFHLTGMLGNCGETGLLVLKMPPTTGPNGKYNVAVDSLDGPAQVIEGEYGMAGITGGDFGVTSVGLTGYIFFDLSTSDLRTNLLYTPDPIDLRVVYNGFSGI